MKSSRILLTGLLLLTSYISQAQTDDKTAVMTVVNNVFEAMRQNDSTLLRQCFTPEAQLFTVIKKPTGETLLHQGELEKFIEAVGRPKREIWDEPIWNEKVHVDGALAAVWVDYAFYVGDQLSHCGVDAFHLIFKDDQWRIFHLTDTRRKSHCQIPEDKQKP